MRLDHIVSSVYIIFVWRAPFFRFYAFRLYFVFLPGGHSGEVIPVPIPNTEVKLSYADDTALRGKVGCCQAFLFNSDIQVKIWGTELVFFRQLTA